MNDTVTIRSGIQYVQAIFKQISILLRTADGLVGDRGFGSAYGNMCIDDMGGTVVAPAKWLPNAVFRFYTSEEWPRVLLYVSVLVDDRYDEYDPMDECLLTAGAFISKTDEWDGDSWKTWWSRWHGFQDARRDDGVVMSSETKDWPEQDETSKVVEKLLTLGRPLPTVRSAEDLKGFLTPLFDAIASYRTGASA